MSLLSGFKLGDNGLYDLEHDLNSFISNLVYDIFEDYFYILITLNIA